MNANQLLQHFATLEEAPNAIPRLRKFILNLAITGKLVPQDTNDEPASELLLKIGKEKARIGIQDRRRDVTRMPFQLMDEPNLPKGWVAVAGFEIFPTRSGNSKLIKGTLHAKPAKGRFPGYSAAGQDVWLDDWEYEGEAIILSAVGARCGKAFLATGKWSAIANTHIVWLLSGIIIPEFAMLHLNNEGFWIRSGGAQPFVKVRGTLERPFPLPPLPEQYRIVAKVKELMALCERVETAKAERETLRNRLATACLTRLVRPTNNDVAQDKVHAPFVLNNLPILVVAPQHIKQLRQTILDLAVRGRLVPQDPIDQPASELLKQIGAGWSENAINVQSEIDLSVEADQGLRGLSRGWQWALIEHCFNVTGGIQKTPARTPRSNAFPYLGVSNVYRGRLELTNIKQFELAEGELDRYRLKADDILVVEGNGSANEIGRCAVWRGEIENCVHQNHIIRCRPLLATLAAYTTLYLNSPDGIAKMKQLAITTAGLYSLSVGKVRKIPLPLPPLGEQHRIVARVNELMALCDRLEAEFATGRDSANRLLDVVLQEALKPVTVLVLEAAQ
jgi:type I restriction enzyme S subunit